MLPMQLYMYTNNVVVTFPWPLLHFTLHMYIVYNTSCLRYSTAQMQTDVRIIGLYTAYLILYILMYADNLAFKLKSVCEVSRHAHCQVASGRYRSVSPTPSRTKVIISSTNGDVPLWRLLNGEVHQLGHHPLQLLEAQNGRPHQPHTSTCTVYTLQVNNEPSNRDT